jgi:uncharacterized membrane protein YczE
VFRQPDSLGLLPPPPQGGVALWRRLVQVVVGLVLYGFSCAVMIQAALGIDPRDTLHQGISVITGVPFGVVVIIVGVGVLLLLRIPLRQKPGIGTVLNVLSQTKARAIS